MASDKSSKISKDRMFLYIMSASLVMILLFGIGAAILTLTTEGMTHDAIITRVISAFQSMFAATISFGVGYLVGKNGNGKNGK